MELGCKGPESFADCWKRGWNNKVNWCIHNSLTEPFIPRYEGDYRLDPKTNKAAVEQYVKALDIRQKCHQMVALFGGKAPIVYGMVAGGATEVPSLDKIVSFKWRLQEIRDFIDNTYLPTVYLVAGAYKDLFNVGAGCKNLISFGYFHLMMMKKPFFLNQVLIPRGRIFL